MAVNITHKKYKQNYVLPDMGEQNMIYKVFLFVFFFQIKSELSEALHQFKENIMDRGTWSTIPQVCNQQNPACGNAYNSDG